MIYRPIYLILNRTTGDTIVFSN